MFCFWRACSLISNMHYSWNQPQPTAMSLGLLGKGAWKLPWYSRLQIQLEFGIVREYIESDSYVNGSPIHSWMLLCFYSTPYIQSKLSPHNILIRHHQIMGCAVILSIVITASVKATAHKTSVQQLLAINLSNIIIPKNLTENLVKLSSWTKSDFTGPIVRST